MFSVLMPAPTLRLAVPAPPPIPRFRVVTAPAPTALPPPDTGYATSVGILGVGGTRIVGMTPANLLTAGRVDITDFRISLFAGVW